VTVGLASTAMSLRPGTNRLLISIIVDSASKTSCTFAYEFAETCKGQQGS
jgi:hypothetical protein